MQLLVKYGQTYNSFMKLIVMRMVLGNKVSRPNLVNLSYDGFT
jgi:hypothetical protein